MHLLQPRMKARVSEQDTITAIIVNTTRKVLLDVEQRCSEALKALEQNDYLVVLGALAGLEEQLRYVTVRLMLLREINEHKNKQLKERRN